MLGVVCDVLGDDVGGAGERLLCRSNALFFIYIGFRRDFDRRVIDVALFENQLGEGREPFAARDGGARRALRAEGAVNVLELDERRCVRECEGNFGGELLLRFDQGGDLLAALVHVAQICQTVEERPQGGIVEAPRHFLAVTGDERDRVSLVDERDGLFDLIGFEFQFLCQGLDNVHRCLLFRDMPRRRGGTFYSSTNGAKKKDGNPKNRNPVRETFLTGWRDPARTAS